MTDPQAYGIVIIMHYSYIRNVRPNGPILLGVVVCIGGVDLSMRRNVEF